MRATALRRHVVPAICGALVAILAWSGWLAGLIAAPLLVLVWRLSTSRKQAFVPCLFYYLVAGRGLFHGAGVFFGDDSALPAWLLGALMWLVPSIILAVVWALAWGRSRQGVRVLCALLVLSVPPIGVFGWANPVTSAGALFPGLGWIGLALTVGLLYVLAQHARPALAALPFVLLAAVVNLSYRAPSVDRWIAVDTHIGSARDAFGEFDRLQALKAALANARAQNPHAVTFVLPELVGGDWSMNRIWWDHEAVDLAAHGQTVLVGAYLPQDKNRRYVNALVSIGADRDQVLVDRVPVPISMWRPLSNTGAIAYWAHGGVARVGGKRAAALICYEELLIWPALLSAAQSPDIFVGSANDWWARGTSIPAIQREATATWARLFGKPFVWAHNV